MRTDLKELDSRRYWFAGSYAGDTRNPVIAATLKKNPEEPLALIHHVFWENNLISDHVWVNWAQQFYAVAPGSKVEFLATAKAYVRKDKTWDYGLNYVAWVQPVGHRQPTIKHPAPATQEEANYLLSLFCYAYSRMGTVRLQHLSRPTEDELIEEFEAKYQDPVWAKDREVRFPGWKDDHSELIYQLALDGWAEPYPRNLSFHAQYSPVLQRLVKIWRDRQILAACQIAAWMNGAAYWQAFGED